MASDPSFVAHVLDLVGLVGPVSARAMFGGHGVYTDGVMFGLLADGELFLKADEVCRARFVEAGCPPFTFTYKDGRVEEMSYYRPPDEAHEDPEAMLPWAQLAVEAAFRTRSAKLAKEARKAKAPAPPRARPAAGGGAKAARPVPGTKKKAPASRTAAGQARPRGKARPGSRPPSRRKR